MAGGCLKRPELMTLSLPCQGADADFGKKRSQMLQDLWEAVSTEVFWSGSREVGDQSLAARLPFMGISPSYKIRRLWEITSEPCQQCCAGAGGLGICLGPLDSAPGLAYPQNLYDACAKVLVARTHYKKWVCSGNLGSEFFFKPHQKPTQIKKKPNELGKGLKWMIYPMPQRPLLEYIYIYNSKINI